MAESNTGLEAFVDPDQSVEEGRTAAGKLAIVDRRYHNEDGVERCLCVVESVEIGADISRCKLKLRQLAVVKYDENGEVRYNGALTTKGQGLTTESAATLIARSGKIRLATDAELRQLLKTLMEAKGMPRRIFLENLLMEVKDYILPEEVDKLEAAIS